MVKFIFTSLFIIFSSCSDKETIDRLSLLSLAQEADSTFSVVLAEKLGAGPTCDMGVPSLAYGKGCVKVFRAKVQNLEFAFVEFDNHEHAKAEAKRLGQYYVKNWVIDEARGEPPIEDFITQAFDAKKY